MSLLLFTLVARADDPKLTVSLSPNPASEDENIQFSLQVSSEDAQNMSTPSFDAPDFTQVGSSSSTSVSSQYVNGKISMLERVSYTYILQPTKSGNLHISNIGVDIGGKHLTANDVYVNVTAGAAPNRQASPQQQEDEDQGANPAAPQGNSSGVSTGTDGKDAPSYLNSDFTVHVKLDKKTAYVGEPIIAEYWLYDFGGLQNVEVQKWPTFTGFWKEDLELVNRYQFQDTYVGNQHARKAKLGRFALYAIKPGKLPIDKLVIEGKYVSRPTRIGNEDDVFNFFMANMGQVRKGTHASEDTSVEILPLPTEGRPENFGGAVGQFRMNLKADKQTAQANTPINFDLTIEGVGNFQAIEQFKLPLPADFELYESNTSVNGSASLGSSRPLDNKKTFHYLVLPRKAGKYTIPAVEWSYFDPAKKSYQKLSTTAINLDVTPDDGTHASNTYSGGGVNTSTEQSMSQPSAPAKLELRYLKPVEAMLQTSNGLWVKFLAGILAFANLILLLTLLMRKFGTSGALLARTPKRRLGNIITGVEKNSASRSEHFSAMDKAVHEVLDVLLQKSTLGMTREELEHDWQKNNYPKDLLEQIQSLLNAADRERYASSRSASLDESVKKKNLEELRVLVHKAQELS